MNPTNNLSYLLQHVAEVTAKQADQQLHEQLGIGLSQYRILMVLEWNPRVQQQVIAESLGQTEAAVSRQVRLLISQGLLTSKADKSNRRKHTTIATPKGMQVTEAAADLLKRSFSSNLRGLSDSESTELTRALLRLHKNVCRPDKLGTCNHQLGF
jgi:DNA-binding MarR family transcriptional regulator